jgi:hypothetical protein
MHSRRSALANVEVDDMIHAEGSNGGSFICLVTGVTNTHIQARTVTHQICLQFDVELGVAYVPGHSIVCTINSTEPLPSDVYDALLGIDERYRTSTDPDRARLSEVERRALIFAVRHYSAPNSQLE